MEEVPKIVRERLRAGAKAEVHPDANLLAGFAEKSLTAREQAQVLEHLAACAECREVVAVAAPEMEVMVAAARAAAAPAYAATPPVARAKWPYMRWVTVAASVAVVGAAAFLLRPKAPTAARQVGAEVSSLKAGTPPQQPAETEAKLEAKVQPPAPPVISLGQEKSDLQRLASARKSRDDLRQNSSLANEHGFVALQKPAAAPPPPPPPPPAVTGTTTAGASGATGEFAKLDAGKKKEEALGDKITQEADASRPVSASQSVNVDGANEVVSVQTTPIQLAQAEASPAKAANTPALARAKAADKDAKQRADAAWASGGSAAYAASPMRSSETTLKLPFLRWTISSDGKLLRSLDDGKNWQPVALGPADILRALSVNGTELWVGGVNGTLFYSANGGTSWQQIRPISDGVVLTSDITRIDSSGHKQGVVITSDKQTWTTSDAGATWQRK